MFEFMLFCKKCNLSKARTQVVVGAGPIPSNLMFVGEAPGKEEDETGIPFIGSAGKIFDKALQEADISRSSVYITNLVKCRPWELGPTNLVRNRQPIKEEINSCSSYLDTQVVNVRPKLIVCLGAIASCYCSGLEVKITKDRGKIINSIYGVPLILTVHPSYVMRKTGKDFDEAYNFLLSDILLAKNYLENLENNVSLNYS